MASEFAHPVERALARVFDAHGIVWQYEPHTIVLARDENGDVREAFTPDFFLPDLDLYLECTVMRQSLTSRKRRKVRLARERAGANVEILFRRDFERLARRWGFSELAHAGSADGDVSAGSGRGTESPDMNESARTLETGAAFRVDVDQRPGVSVVAVEGDVDLHSAPVLRTRLAALADAETAHVVLDLSDATFLDSMALGVILVAQKRLVEAGGRLDLVAPTPEIRRIFEITMLDQVFDLHDTRAEAVRNGDNRAS
jgi:hypoxanthine phosphoribosyltransferase